MERNKIESADKNETKSDLENDSSYSLETGFSDSQKKSPSEEKVRNTNGGSISDINGEKQRKTEIKNKVNGYIQNNEKSLIVDYFASDTPTNSLREYFLNLENQEKLGYYSSVSNDSSNKNFILKSEYSKQNDSINKKDFIPPLINLLDINLNEINEYHPKHLRPPEESSIINNYFSEILYPNTSFQNIREICLSSDGESLLQEKFETFTQEDFSKFFSEISPFVDTICFSPNGSRILQNFVEKNKTNQELLSKLIISLTNSKNIFKIIRDKFGNHLITKIIETKNEHVNLIYEIIINNFLYFTNNKYSVYVEETCLYEGNSEQRNKIYKLIIENLNDIIFDPFGSCLLLDMFDKDNDRNKKIINEISSIENSIIKNCKEKLYYKYKDSEKVIERICFNDNTQIHGPFLQFLAKEPELVKDMLLDQFGNYSVQRLLEISNNKEEKQKIIQIICDKKEIIKRDELGKKVYAKLCNDHPEEMKSYYENKNKKELMKKNKCNRNVIFKGNKEKEYRNSTKGDYYSENSFPCEDNYCRNREGCTKNPYRRKNNKNYNKRNESYFNKYK